MRKFIDRNMMRIVCTSFAIMLASLMFFSAYDSPINGDITECYDRFKNIIEDQECVVDGKFDERSTAIIFSTVIGLLMIVMGYILGGSLDYMSRSFAYSEAHE